ncbi:deoxynucleotidyltransferase terminal-interacting protein 2-like [Sitodiplosis mosellana]|uniref:deoxynucleotidyltransferase terminal-interacting protein 2-like n=1 Tax=Sitodiplosis mosellana TaxID=263140 RepID=UPI002444DACB|nr:deoxynucleotidyltransferase terminal-interacting protein 2-like [Sitodiplosis mosellana]
MGKTPTIAKTRKSVKTPKTVPKKLIGTPKMESKEMSGTRLSLRRTKLDTGSGASPKLASFITPSRTTRSMLKVTSNDALHSYVTPIKSSKRKTIASAKAPVACGDNVKSDGGDSNDAFVRPLPPKAKRMDKVQAEGTVVDETPTISESTEASNDEVKKGRKRARKGAKMNSVVSEMEDGQNDESMERRTRRKTKRVEEVSAESSEEDWPSVSIFGATETPTGQFVRSRKTLQTNGGVVESGDEDFASVSQLGLNTSGRFVRSRKTMHGCSDNVATSEDDLPSVSFLGASATPAAKFAQRRKSKLSIEPKDNETVSEAIEQSAAKPTLNKRISLSESSRKSNQGVKVAVESNDLSSSDVPKPSRMSGQVVRSRKSTQGNIENENVMDTEDDSKDQVENGHDENGSGHSNDEMAADEDNKENGNIPTIEITAAKSEASELSKVDEDSTNIKVEKAFKNNRISIVDLTDSPMVQNKSVLNETFTAEDLMDTEEQEEEEKKEDAEAKDRTFTDDNNTTAINEKTFSPIPLSVKKFANKAAVTPAPVKGRASLNVTTKSTAKKKSPQLKRLQSTPYLKPKTRNNLFEPAKLSSAKKAKVVEAAIELVEPLKRKSMDRVKVPKVAIQSPKVFKFGDENNHGEGFRFSLCAKHLKNNQETGKSAVKRAPNFTNMHNRMFDKIESITETRDRHDQRAKLLLSGKKPTQAQALAQAKVVKPIVKNPPPKFVLDVNRGSAEKRRPLAADNHVNRARLNDEERQERRKQLFKQGSKRASIKKNPVPAIKGVRMNRRFELMMKNRNASKKN